MSLCIIYSTITVSNANSNNGYRTRRGLGLDESEFTNQFVFILFTLLGHTTSVNNVVVTVLHLLRALYRRSIVYRIL